MNSWLLDMTGIMFAAQLVTLLIIGPFTDYGNWRPWILISRLSSSLPVIRMASS